MPLRQSKKFLIFPVVLLAIAGLFELATPCQAQPQAVVEDNLIPEPELVLAQIHPQQPLSIVPDQNQELNLTPYPVHSGEIDEIAQSVPTDVTGSDPLGDEPTLDLTPVNLPRRNPSFDRFDQFKSGMLYRLPSKMFFTGVVDNSVRLETNVFQTNSRNSSDFIYRVLPNLTLGYALTKRTRVSANYFLLRDQYTKFDRPLSRTLQSVGFQVTHDVPLKDRANLSFGYFNRALFSSLDYIDDPPFLFDIIPSVTLTKPIGNNTIAYGSVLGQVRFRRMFDRYQEFDQFYSGGVVHRKGGWTFLADSTLASNFGRPIYRGGGNNQVIILTEEVARKINPRYPIQTYIRSQQIFNIGAPQSPGFAGFNYRIFGGIRVTVAKPPIFPIKLKDI